ncbi:hypothetical protein BGY98DRAFT_553498 [Russula aff. rugulosa BPL654]|nr:hypothetical protein BGY98DRAFT_553498 [Russula aff. rugulosa BPL654]
MTLASPPLRQVPYNSAYGTTTRPTSHIELVTSSHTMIPGLTNIHSQAVIVLGPACVPLHRHQHFSNPTSGVLPFLVCVSATIQPVSISKAMLVMSARCLLYMTSFHYSLNDSRWRPCKKLTAYIGRTSVTCSTSSSLLGFRYTAWENYRDTAS